MDLTHSDDFAKGFVPLLGNTRTIGEAFHITSDDVLTWNQITMILAKAAGAEPKIVHVPSDAIAAADPVWGAALLGDSAHSMIFDNSKLRSVVPDYVATITLEQAAPEIIAWHDQDPSRQAVDVDLDALMNKLSAEFRVQGYPLSVIDPRTEPSSLLALRTCWPDRRASTSTRSPREPSPTCAARFEANGEVERHRHRPNREWVGPPLGDMVVAARRRPGGRGRPRCCCGPHGHVFDEYPPRPSGGTGLRPGVTDERRGGVRVRGRRGALRPGRLRRLRGHHLGCSPDEEIGSLSAAP